MLLFLEFAVLLRWSWGKWPDAIVDFGRELYVPWRLAAGDRLYTDIAYFNGPLSPWWNALLFQGFGVSLLTLVVANLVIVVAIAAMLYFLLQGMGSRLVAAVGTGLFLGIFAFGQYMEQGNYNFVTPYSHEMTHGTFLSLAALSLVWVHVRRGGAATLFACGLAVGLTLLTKAEFFLAAAAGVLVALVLRHRVRRGATGDLLRQGAVLAAGVVVPPLAALVLLLPGRFAGEAIRAVLGPWPNLFATELMELKFYRDILGVGELGDNLRLAGAWTLRYAAFLLCAALASILLRRSRPGSSTGAVLLAPLAAAAVLARWRTTDWADIARPLPLAMCVGGVVLAVLLTRPGATEAERLRRVLALSFVVYSFVLLWKVILNVRIMHYGFALAMPASLVLVLGLVDGIPSLLDRRGFRGTAFRAASLGILAAVLAMHVYATHTWFRLRTESVGWGADAFRADVRGRMVTRILDRVGSLRSPQETVAVLPEGVMINYLSRARNPTPYINFLPPEVLMFGEDRIVEALEGRPPDWIVLADRKFAEYGFRRFGEDFATKIFDWIQENYTLVEKLDADSPGDDGLRFALILRLARDHGSSEPGARTF